jgi:ABC-type oligopeptide transport system ATPase subunit
MHRGRLVEIDDTEALFAGARHPYTRALLAAIPIPDPDRELERRRIASTGNDTYPERGVPG